MFAFLTLKITQRLNPTSGVSGRSKTMHIKSDKALGFEISDTPWNTLISIGIAKSKYQFSSIHTIHTFLSMAFKTGISDLVTGRSLRVLGCVQTWCPSTVPENDSQRALMWTHLFFKYPRQNSGTVPVPEYKVSTLYSGTELGIHISGTQCLNTAPFCARARALVLGHQVWTQPPTLSPCRLPTLARSHQLSTIVSDLNLLNCSWVWTRVFTCALPRFCQLPCYLILVRLGLESSVISFNSEQLWSTFNLHFSFHIKTIPKQAWPCHIVNGL